ncbi:MAG TPA: DNA polymerase I, partial [Patescibacteria group bacterium]|nr:DNA polymerase I [Patescibacteria group bacterium]
GVGEKTALDLVVKYGGIENMYQLLGKKKLTEISPSVLAKLESGKKDAEMSFELAKIVTAVPGVKVSLPLAKVKDLDVEKLSALFRKFEFYSLLKRLRGEEKDDNKKEKKILVNNLGGKETAKRLEASKTFACQAVSDNEQGTSLILLTGEELFFVPVTQIEELAKVFFDKKKILVGHDLKPLLKMLLAQGISVQNQLFDTMVASYLLNSSTRSHDLRSVVLRELGENIVTKEDQGSLFEVSREVVAKELLFTLSVAEKQRKHLEDLEDLGLFEKVEMRLIPVLAEMEKEGVAVDERLLHSLSRKVAEDLERITRKIWKEAGEEFNVASSVQLREILFEKMSLPKDNIKKGKTGYSTADSELDKLIDIHPIVPLIREYRELAKLQNTYIDVLPGLINKKTGRIHTTFNQAVATTGRLSSSDPNLQNIPIRTELGREIRKAFIAEKGNQLVVADYSQIELRVVASLAQDKKMLEIFSQGKDIHTATAAAIHGVPLSAVTKEMRYSAKEVNFGVLYGMGAYGLAWRTKIPKWQADEFIKKYFSEFSGVKKYIDQTLRLARKTGYVETLFGRRRYIPELKSSNFQLRAAGERMAVNMPIQGTAADIMKMAMIAVATELSKYNTTEKKVRLILQVHDELVIEVVAGLEKEVATRVKEIMENTVKLRVPVDVQVGIGKRWGEIK